MPNNEDLDDLHNVSLDFSFSPLASSSQQCSTTANDFTQPDQLQIAENLHRDLQAMHSNSMSKFGLWSSFVNPNTTENDQEITLTQLNTIASGHKIWNLKQWINAQEEYSKDMECTNISCIKKTMNQNQVIPFLAAVLLRVDSSNDMLVMNSVTLTLKDPSGEIKAVLPKELHAECKHLLPNSVVVLRNFRILKISKDFARYYILLKKANIEAVFSTKTHSKITFFTHAAHAAVEDTQKLVISSTKQKEQTIEVVLNKTDFVMPDLDVDLDFDADLSSTQSTKSTQLNQSSQSNQTKKQKLQVTPAQSQVVNNISNLHSESCETSAPRRFKYVKRNNAEVTKATLNINSDKSQINNCNSSQISVKAQNPQDAHIVEEIFDGMDVSCFLDDF